MKPGILVNEAIFNLDELQKESLDEQRTIGRRLYSKSHKLVGLGHLRMKTGLLVNEANQSVHLLRNESLNE